ncbi:hypothetical protein [Alteromonas sp. AO-Serp]|nr:hypothetical protein [Alteromonas sp. AO-Serp]
MIAHSEGAGKFPGEAWECRNGVPFQIPRMKLGSLPDLPEGRV